MVGCASRGVNLDLRTHGTWRAAGAGPRKKTVEETGMDKKHRTGRSRTNQNMPRASFSRLPNLITLARIALVPVLILLLKDQEYAAGLIVFVIAGASDALDGYLAKRLNVQSRMGAILDPVADKLLLVSAYVMLTVLGHIPFWLMLVVTFRDLLIVVGYVVYTSHAGPVKMRPSVLSKLNTLAQIALATLILAQQAAGLDWPLTVNVLVIAVLVTTVVSGAHYLWSWIIIRDIEHAPKGEKPHD
jgi:cardiolipin synthase (CMP-forming)